MNMSAFGAFVFSTAVLGIQGCGGSSSTSETTDSTATQTRDLSSFPISLMVTSPTEIDTVDTVSRSMTRAVSYHGYVSQRIDQLLAGSTL